MNTRYPALNLSAKLNRNEGTTLLSLIMNLTATTIDSGLLLMGTSLISIRARAAATRELPPLGIAKMAAMVALAAAGENPAVIGFSEILHLVHLVQRPGEPLVRPGVGVNVHGNSPGW